MKIKLTVFFMFFLCFNSFGKIEIDRIGSTVRASTNIPSKPGYKGCNGVPKSVKGYIFQLHKRTQKEDFCYIGPPPDWVIEESISTNKNSYEFINLREGDYKVVVLYARPLGCFIEEKNTRSISYTQEESQLIHIAQKDDNSDISNNYNLEMLLYPNPADESIIIEMQDYSGGGITNVQVFNIAGEIVYSTKIETENYQRKEKLKINTSSFLQGNYFVLLIDENNNYYRKQIVVIHNNDSSDVIQQTENIKN